MLKVNINNDSQPENITPFLKVVSFFLMARRLMLLATGRHQVATPPSDMTFGINHVTML